MRFSLSSLAKNGIQLFFALLLLSALASCASKRAINMYPSGYEPGDQVATLDIPVDVTLSEFDGDSPPLTTKLLAGNQVTYRILPGDHLAKIAYRHVWDDAQQDIIPIKSRPIRLSFVAEAGKHYEIRHESPQSIKEAKKLAKNFSAQVYDTATNQVAEPANYDRFVQQRDQRRRLEYRQNFAQTPGSSEFQKAQKTVPSTTNQVASNVPTSAPAWQASSAGNLEAGKMLRYWWEKAPQNDRGSFLTWVALRKGTADTASKNSEPSPISLLKFWWTQAGEAQREEFLGWVAQ